MTITEWFDPSLPEHREAYRYLMGRGTWPVGFIPNGLGFTPMWAALLASKIANYFLDRIELSDRDLRPTFGAWALKEEE